jgi:hypothetical protein
MSDAAQGASASTKVGLARVGIGLLQGLALYGLHYAATGGKHVWPATEPMLYGILLVVTAFIPLILLAGLGSMRPLTLAVWTAVATAVTAGLVAWDYCRDAGGDHGLSPSFPVVPFTAAFLFIANHLIAPADAERKPIASHRAYFDTTWKHGVQLALSLGFVGAVWAALHLGGALFDLIGLHFFTHLIQKEWFILPVSAVTFAAAVHLTDVRAGITRGFRTVGLMLLSWLMPVMGAIALAFLVALIFTGLDPLWKLGRSTAILLSAAAALIILINAAYQDGQADTRAPLVLRWAARITALTITPLLVIAAIGLWLRIGQYGLTPERIIAIACTIVGACYAVGYGIAAVLPGPWMKPLELTNVLTAFVILAVILALFTPVADPARISVHDQVSRLEQGKIAPEKFDYAFMRFRAGKWGREALKKLAANTKGPNAATVSQKAKDALAMKNYYESYVTPPPAPTQFVVYPAGTKLPDSFLNQDWKASPPCVGMPSSKCEAWLVDMDGDGKPEVLVGSGSEVSIFKLGPDGQWSREGWLSGYCPGFMDGMRSGSYHTAPSQWRDIEIDGKHYAVTAQGGCPN